MVIGIVSTYFLFEMTNPSMVYHWIRGQADFKIYFLKTLCEICNSMLSVLALSVLNNFSKEFQIADAIAKGKIRGNHIPKKIPYIGFLGRRLVASSTLLIFTMLHSWVLTMEMLIIHVVLTQNYSSWFQFCIMNSVVELKISVFKKCDLGGLFDYANNDATDRFHVAIYIVATLLQTSQDPSQVLQQAVMMYIFKMLVDYLKHFFLTRMNKISI